MRVRECLFHFVNMLLFCSEDLVGFRPTPKLEDHSLSSIRNCLNAIISLYNFKRFVFVMDFLRAYRGRDSVRNACYLPCVSKRYVGKFFWKYFAVSLSLSFPHCSHNHLNPRNIFLWEQAGEIWELGKHCIGCTFT